MTGFEIGSNDTKTRKKKTKQMNTFDSLRRVHTQEPACAGEPWGGTKVWTLSQIPYENNHTPLLAAGLVDCLENKNYGCTICVGR